LSGLKSTGVDPRVWTTEIRVILIAAAEFSPAQDRGSAPTDGVTPVALMGPGPLPAKRLFYLSSEAVLAAHGEAVFGFTEDVRAATGWVCLSFAYMQLHTHTPHINHCENVQAHRFVHCLSGT